MANPKISNRINLGALVKISQGNYDQEFQAHLTDTLSIVIPSARITQIIPDTKNFKVKVTTVETLNSGTTDLLRYVYPDCTLNFEDASEFVFACPKLDMLEYVKETAESILSKQLQDIKDDEQTGGRAESRHVSNKPDEDKGVNWFFVAVLAFFIFVLLYKA